MSTGDPGPLFRRDDIARRFDATASRFDSGDFLHRQAFEGLLARLEPMQLEPRRIIDLGSAAGSGSVALAKIFRRALVVSVDLSQQMLLRGLSKRGWRSRIRGVRADAHALPFRAGSVDMVFTNLALPWFAIPEACVGEVSRVLRKEGLMVFSTLGPDTLSEVRDAWREADGGALESHVHPFADMHDVGDALVRAGLADPVLDVERLTITYDDMSGLWSDLRVAGARNMLAGRPAGLTGRARFRRFEDALRSRSESGRLGISIELVFGHAWGAGQRRSPQEFRIDPANIARRRRNS